MAATLPSRRQTNYYVLAIIIALAIFISLGLHHIIGGFLGAIIFYVIFRPLNIYLQEKKNWNKTLSTALILILSFFCMIVPIFFVIKMLSDQVMYYVNNPELVETMLKNINDFATNQLNDPNLIDRTVNTLKSEAAGVVTNIINTSANTFVQLVIMYFTLYFAIKNFRAFESGIVQYLPFKKADSHRIGYELRNMTYSNILGQGCIAIIQGTLLGIGFLIFGIDNAVFWGVIGVFLAMIPFFGTPLVFVPAGLIQISNGNVGSGVGIILYGYLLVTMIDNFIRAAIGKRIANTHPLITVIGVVIGFPLFGILGLLFGPLLLSLFIILVKIYKTNQAEIMQMEESAS